MYFRQVGRKMKSIKLEMNMVFGGKFILNTVVVVVLAGIGDR